MDLTVSHPYPLPVLQEEPSEEQLSPAPIPSERTPQEFYAEITSRQDVRTILEELATG